MRRFGFAAAAVLLAAFTASSALAQEEEESTPLSTAPTEAQKKVPYNEVEHGFFVGAFTGLALTVKPGGTVYDGSGNPSSPGMAMGQSGGIELGIEPTPAFSIGILAEGSAANTPSLYYGTCDPSAGSCPHGNYTALTLGADARLNLSLGPDVNGIRRSYFFIRAGAGYSILSPKGMLQNELLVFGGPGFEYFTHLRHFSVGIEADATFGVTNKGLGLSLQPLVRYGF
jgi:opacity protein-like surface antigen